MIAISIAVSDPSVIDRSFGKSEETTTLSGTLAALLHDLITVGQVTAWILGVYSLKGLIGDLTGIPEWHHNSLPPGLVLWPILITVAGLFLSCWTGRRRGSISLSYSVAVSLIFITAIAAIGGIIKLIAAVMFIIVGPFLSAVADGIAAYVMTWPISMVARILEAPSPLPRDWALPQVPAIRMGAAELSVQYREYLRRHRGKGKKSWQSGPSELILERLDEARTTVETEQILRNLAVSPLDANTASVNVLRDLARALEWVNRMVPFGTTTSIPPGIWDLGPKFSSSTFCDWLRQFDKHHPGRLSWLAGNHREEIAQALKRADAQNA